MTTSDRSNSLNPPSEAVHVPIRKFIAHAGEYRWTDVPQLQYKETGTHFKQITRQVLFGGHGDSLPTEFRYFEMAANGYSTLERHQHEHAVLILRGSGRVLVGEQVYPVAAFDAVYIAPQTWHQFRAHEDEPLGFLCLVDCTRDRPVRPSEEDLRALRSIPQVADFIRV